METALLPELAESVTGRYLEGLRDGGVAVNCSPVQLESSDVAAVVRKCLQKSGLPANRLEIEVTERSSSMTARASLRSCNSSRRSACAFRWTTSAPVIPA